MKVSSLECFWTWSFGHIWAGNSIAPSSYNRQCSICGKESTKGSYDGEWHYDISKYAISTDSFLLRKERAAFNKQFKKSILALKTKKDKLMEILNA